MEKHSALRHRFDPTTWKVAFTQALLRLRPEMNPDAADEVSDSALGSHHARDPVVSASDWALLDAADTVPERRLLSERADSFPRR
jgi:hypothetical protein